MAEQSMPDREYYVLQEMMPSARAPDVRTWLTPMMFGGRNSSHHSATARRLAERGLVEMRSREMAEPYTVDQVREMKGRFKRQQEGLPAWQRRRGARGGPKVYRISEAGIAAYRAERERRRALDQTANAETGHPAKTDEDRSQADTGE